MAQYEANSIKPRRLLSLEIRSRRFGFVVLDGVSKLLDWGARGCGKDPAFIQAVTTKRFMSVVMMHRPTLVVFRTDYLNRSSEAARNINAMIDTIRAECGQQPIEIRSISTRTIRSFFDDYQCRTKYAIALLISEWFEELGWALPPQRKPWEGEHHNTVIFDALATAMAYFGTSETAFGDASMAPQLGE